MNQDTKPVDADDAPDDAPKNNRVRLWHIIRDMGEHGLTSKEALMLMTDKGKGTITATLSDLRIRGMVSFVEETDKDTNRLIRRYYTDRDTFLDRPLPKGMLQHRSKIQGEYYKRTRAQQQKVQTWPTAPVQPAPAPAPAPVQEQTPKFNGIPHRSVIDNLDPNNMTVSDLLAAVQKFDELKAKLRGLLG